VTVKGFEPDMSIKPEPINTGRRNNKQKNRRTQRR